MKNAWKNFQNQIRRQILKPTTKQKTKHRYEDESSHSENETIIGDESSDLSADESSKTDNGIATEKKETVI